MTTTSPLLSAAEVERIAEAVARRLRPYEREALSLEAAARVLGVDRSRTLATLIAAGSVKTVNVAGHVRISREEISRVLREGAPLNEPAPRARRRRATEVRTDEEEIAAILAIKVGGR